MADEPEIKTGFKDFLLSQRDEEFLIMLSELKDEFDRAVLAAMPRLCGEYFEAKMQNQPDPEVLQQMRAAAVQLGNAGIHVDGHTMAQALIRAEKEDDTNG